MIEVQLDQFYSVLKALKIFSKKLEYIAIKIVSNHLLFSLGAGIDSYGFSIALPLKIDAPPELLPTWKYISINFIDTFLKLKLKDDSNSLVFEVSDAGDCLIYNKVPHVCTFSFLLDGEFSPLAFPENSEDCPLFEANSSEIEQGIRAVFNGTKKDKQRPFLDCVAFNADNIVSVDGFFLQIYSVSSELFTTPFLIAKEQVIYLQKLLALSEETFTYQLNDLYIQFRGSVDSAPYKFYIKLPYAYSEYVNYLAFVPSAQLFQATVSTKELIDCLRLFTDSYVNLQLDPEDNSDLIVSDKITTTRVNIIVMEGSINMSFSLKILLKMLATQAKVEFLSLSTGGDESFGMTIESENLQIIVVKLT